MTRPWRAFLRRWPLWTALTITALVEVLSWLAFSQPATDCRPAEILSGCGEAPPLDRLLRVLGIEAVIVFVAVLLVALLVRWFARVVMRVGRRLTGRAAPAADHSGTAPGRWWRGHRRISAALLVTRDLRRRRWRRPHRAARPHRCRRLRADPPGVGCPAQRVRACPIP